MRPWRFCAYCGHRSHAYTCRFHTDLPALDNNGRERETQPMPTVRMVEAAQSARERGA